MRGEGLGTFRPRVPVGALARPGAASRRTIGRLAPQDPTAWEPRRWPISASPSPKKKKLYIETVGCQMNVLDSELVVARLRRQGYELTDDIEPGRRHPLQHLQRPPARRGQDL